MGAVKRIMYLALGILLVINLVNSQFSSNCNLKSLCSCATADGKESLDLQPFVENNNGQPTVADNRVDQYNYKWLPCNSNGFACGRAFAAVCQGTIIAGNPSPVIFITDPKTGIVSIKYSSDSRISIINLSCSSGNKLTFVGEDPGLTYNFNLESKYACCKGCSSVPISSNVGISPGSILLIVFICFIVTYLVVGFIINGAYFKRSGKDMVPQLALWMMAPGMIKDGALFVVNSTCRRGSAGSKSNYGNYDQL